MCGGNCNACKCPPRDHEDDCDCSRCLKMGMEYLRDKVYQLEMKNRQLCEVIDTDLARIQAANNFDLKGDG